MGRNLYDGDFRYKTMIYHVTTIWKEPAQTLINISEPQQNQPMWWKFVKFVTFSLLWIYFSNLQSLQTSVDMFPL